MQLPDDVLEIIREYSKPLTRPDWRTCRPLSGHAFFTELIYSVNNKINKKLSLLSFASTNDAVRESLLTKRSLHNCALQYMLNTQWGQIYKFVRNFGIYYASIHFNIPLFELCKFPGVEHAQTFYVKHY